MTTVQQIAETTKKKINTAVVEQNVEVVFDDGKTLLLKGTNARGSFEVLFAEDTRHLADSLYEVSDPVTLIGFFRARKSFREDGSPFRIWTFCPTGLQEEMKMAA